MSPSPKAKPKPPPKPKPPKPYRVVWYDAHGNVDGWTPIKGIDTGGRKVVSVGLLIHKDENYIVLASSLDSDTESVSGVTNIPRACVSSITLLR